MSTPATRLNLLRARRRLDRVTRGAALLRRKREALVTELFRLAQRAVHGRQRITQRAAEAYPALLEALAQHGRAGLTPLGWPTRDIHVEVHAHRVWGIAVADILGRSPVARTLAARGTTPGATGPAAVETARHFEELIDAVLDAATRESLIRRLGEALAQTSRQVNTLERRVSPALSEQIAGVQRVLDEREREEQGRLRRLVKRRSATHQREV